MPEQTLSPKSPEAAAKDAVSRVLAGGSDLPLVDAANLLIKACRDADPRDPGWAMFLEQLNQGELDSLTVEAKRRRRRGASRLRVV